MMRKPGQKIANDQTIDTMATKYPISIARIAGQVLRIGNFIVPARPREWKAGAESWCGV
jgi:hypothetical protein